MKYIRLYMFTVFITFSLLGESMNACEVCGCGASNTYFGLQPNMSRNFLGMRYRTMHFQSHLNMGERFRTEETFRITELLGRWYPADRLQIMASVPYSLNTQNTRTGSISLDGFGDMALAVNYNIIEQDNTCAEDEFSHALIAGGGIKLPTGKYHYSEDVSNEEVDNPNFQLGTGSTDFLILTQYIVRLGKYGLSADGQAKINTANSNNYRFGDRFSGNVRLFAVLDNETWKIMPNIGLYGETSNSDKNNAVPLSVTGGYLLNGLLGADVFWENLMVGVNVQLPIRQSLGNNSLQSNNRFMTTIAWMF